MITRVWDAAVLLLVIFPLSTGGIWLDRPGLHIELAQLGVPVLIVAILTAALARGIHPRKSLVIGWANGLWAIWSRSGFRGALYGALAMGVLMSIASLRRHWALGSNADDLGIFQGALWNLVHGNGLFSPQKGTHLFQDHLYFSIYLLTPLFALAPRPETLLIVQGFTLALGALPLYFLGKQHAPGEAWIAQAAPLLYWLYLPMRNGNAFDFHPDTIMLPAGLATLAGLQSAKHTRRALGALALLLFMSGKESSGPVLTGLGISWAIGAAPITSREFCRRVGLALVPLGFAWFWLETQWVPGHVFNSDYSYNGAYADLGEGLGGILTAPFRVPGAFFGRFFALSRAKFLFFTLGGLAFLPLLSWRQAISAVPAIAMIFLSQGDRRVDLYYYYANEASISFLWALPAGWENAKRWSRSYSNRTLLLAWVLFWALGLSGRSELYRIRYYAPSEHALWVRRELVPCVAPSIPIAATGVLVPQLGDRSWAAAIPRQATPSGPVECVIIDRQVNPWGLTPERRDAFARGLLSEGFHPIFDCQGVQVLQRKSRCLECTPVCQRP